MKRALLAAALAFCPGGLAAAEEPGFHLMSRKEIPGALKLLHSRHRDLQDRFVAVSARFLGTPYRLGPLGEGDKGEFDRDPTVNFKEADCTTFIEQAMALALEPDLKKAVNVLQRIRYKDGRLFYESRNHFPEIDWIENNIRAGYLRDITAEVAGDKLRVARKTISKSRWYSEKTLDDLEGFEGEALDHRMARLERLRALGLEFEDREAALPYAPLESIPAVQEKIPSGAIANLVREDRADKPILVSHQILIIDKAGRKFARHAASGRKVEDVPLLEYLGRYKDSPWPLVGLNFNRLTAPRKP